MIKKIADPEVEWARSAADHELERWEHLGQTGFRQVAAMQELKRRAFWRDFWSKGVVAWLALALSIASLGVSLFHRSSEVNASASSTPSVPIASRNAPPPKVQDASASASKPTHVQAHK